MPKLKISDQFMYKLPGYGIWYRFLMLQTEADLGFSRRIFENFVDLFFVD